MFALCWSLEGAIVSNGSPTAQHSVDEASRFGGHTHADDNDLRNGRCERPSLMTFSTGLVVNGVVLGNVG